MEERVYRIKVEKRPTEKRDRYYPEYALKTTAVGVIIDDDCLRWKSFNLDIMSDDIWSYEKKEAEKAIEDDMEDQKVKNGFYIKEIINYDKK